MFAFVSDSASSTMFLHLLVVRMKSIWSCVSAFICSFYVVFSFIFCMLQFWLVVSYTLCLGFVGCL